MSRIELKRILCPVDFSDFSRRALDQAVNLAGYFNSEIQVLHVFPLVVPLGGEMPYFPAPSPPGKSTMDELHSELAEFVAPAREAGARTVMTRVIEGNPSAEIVGQARAMGADLLVMGTHGRAGFERWILGSVTEKVVRKAPCPVLTVGRKPNGAKGGGLPFRRILCAVDLWGSERTVDYAFAFAQEAGANVLLFHAIEQAPVEGLHLRISVDVRGIRKELEETAYERLRAIVPQGARDWCEIKEVVRFGTAYKEILRLAQEEEADLIVAGVHGRTPIDALFFGSTANHLVREAPCPVMTIRPQAQLTREAHLPW